ncbi:MAG: YeeE/YedE family protein, partial [Ilumatobacteraceae bacterium]
FGIALGGLAAVLLKEDGFVARKGYDVLLDANDMNLSLPVASAVIFVGAIVMGYGARMAGGCTSGHGICGTAQRSPASWAATISFMSAAVVTTFFVKQF